MTHKDIYTKFMIEYDKANVTSSYPSLTKYEVATILDKSYNTLIDLKFTGNNTRRVGFETDNKVIADLQPLVKRTVFYTEDNKNSIRSSVNLAPNVRYFKIPESLNWLYFVSGAILTFDEEREMNPVDDPQPIVLINHTIADKFFVTPYNYPWIKTPVCYLEDDRVNIIIDPDYLDKVNGEGSWITLVSFVYIQQPKKFTDDEDVSESTVNFELSDTMADELITLAVSYTLENVESPRLNNHLQMRGLES